MGALDFVGAGARTTGRDVDAFPVPYTTNPLAAGDRHLLFMSHKRHTILAGITADAADGVGNTWTKVADNVQVGTGATAVDDGPIVFDVWEKPYAPGEAAPTVAHLSGGTTADGWQAWIVTYRPAAGEDLSVVYIGSGTDATNDTTFASTTTTAIDLAVDDVVASFFGMTVDSAGSSGRTNSVSGVTLDNGRFRVGSGFTGGNDHWSGVIDNLVTATTAPGPFTVVAEATLAAASTGGHAAFRLRSAPQSTPTGPTFQLHTGSGLLVPATLLGIHDGAGGFTPATPL